MTSPTHQLTWLGHGTFLLETSSNMRILFDPWIDGNPSFPHSYELQQIHLILITHGHYDHIASTPDVWLKNKPKVIGIFELCNWLERKGVDTVFPMNKGGSTFEAGIKITMVNADHSCGITDDDGKIIYGGESVGYVLKLDSNQTLYFAGDTNIFESMRLIQRLYTPNVACLPIGDRFTMGPMEAVEAAKLLKIERFIPMHYGTFPELTGTPAQVKSLLEGSDIEFIVPEIGIPIPLMSSES